MTSTHEETTTTSDPTWVVDTARRMQTEEASVAEIRRFFDHYHQRSIRFLRQRGMRPDEADDLAQTAMLGVYSGIGQFSWQASVSSWILTIVDNTRKKYLRHLGTKARSAESVSVEGVLEDHHAGTRATLPAGLTADSPDPQAAALASERRRQLVEALETLPDQMYRCLLLRYQGLRYKEIGRLLDIKSDTVKKHLNAGRKRLRPLVGDLFGILLVLIGPWFAGR